MWCGVDAIIEDRSLTVAGKCQSNGTDELAALVRAPEHKCLPQRYVGRRHGTKSMCLSVVRVAEEQRSERFTASARLSRGRCGDLRAARMGRSPRWDKATLVPRFLMKVCASATSQPPARHEQRAVRCDAGGVLLCGVRPPPLLPGPLRAAQAHLEQPALGRVGRADVGHMGQSRIPSQRLETRVRGRSKGSSGGGPRDATGQRS